MKKVSVSIDGKQVQVEEGTSVLTCAWQANIYIPQLCAHPVFFAPRGDAGPGLFSGGSKAPSTNNGYPAPKDYIFIGGQRYTNDHSTEYDGCGLCLVSIEGRDGWLPACTTPVAEGMKIRTDTPALRVARQKRLSSLLLHHPHACLMCAQNRGCSLTQCSSNVPPAERCCPVFQQCELRKVAEYIGIPPETPRYQPRGLPTAKDTPLIQMDFNLCISCLRCVKICQDIRGVGALGYISYRGEILVGTVAPTLQESACRFCRACVEVCPTGALRDTKPRGREVPCQSACPVEMDIPNYIRAIAQGDYEKSAEIISSHIPLTPCLSRVCHHPCESACLWNELGQPIAICGLKRFALDYAKFTPPFSISRGDSGAEDDFVSSHKLQREAISSPAPNPVKVAIIGSGPAGLSAGYYLRKKGYSVTIFEKEPQAGGMLRWGIPRFRLPEKILHHDLSALQNMGIELRTGAAIDNPASLMNLKEQGYRAIFIATGAGLSKKIPLPGTDLEGVFWGLDFLKSVNSGLSFDFHGKKVVVIGGGNVAMDVALTARRFDASSVDIVCLEKRDEMPAFKKEIENAVEEGIILHPGWGPRQILGASGKVSGVEFILCTRVFDEEGRFNPALDESTSMTLPADVVILAIGQVPDFSHFPPEALNTMGRVAIDPATLQTSIPGIFAGGEAVKSPSSVVEAISTGKRAAEAIHRYLAGDGMAVAEDVPSRKEWKGWLGRVEGFAYSRRENMPSLPLNQRQGFDEVALGFSEEMAVNEAKRCLQCDLRLAIPPVPLPPPKYHPLNLESILKIEEAEGVIQLLNENLQVVLIKGTPNIRNTLKEQLNHKTARYFLYELDPMFTKRESELLQEHLRKYGTLPQEELEDLF